ncbi:hypothetical protein F4808DRAFT_469474 [Astrocystis sublimbata]|nr:hypothetical protein F4808DRAFT_469474 [Astrocystis sublimbata]
MKLKRSHSTPNVRLQGMHDPDADALSLSADKKRNRLGYARTNMACGNCRKRKIRCQPVKDDGRCSQCIRLKKDCQFYAVDQQPPPSVVRAGSRPIPKTMLASAAIAPGYPNDVQAHQSYQGRTMVVSHDMGPPSTRSDPFVDDTKVGAGSQVAKSFSYGQGVESWASTATSPTAKHSEMNPSWRSYPPESPIAPGYAPYSVASLSQASTTWTTTPLEATAGSEGPSRSQDTWSSYPQPTRSMSFSGEHPVQYSAVPSRGFDKKSSMASNTYQPTTMENAPSAPYTTWQQPYQTWYVEGGSQQPQTPSHIDGMYHGS